MVNRVFTNQSKSDIPLELPSEDYTRMYAAWGRFIELSGSFIPWDKFLDYSEPESVVIGVNEKGEAIVETTIKLRHCQELTGVPDGEIQETTQLP